MDDKYPEWHYHSKNLSTLLGHTNCAASPAGCLGVLPLDSKAPVVSETAVIPAATTCSSQQSCNSENPSGEKSGYASSMCHFNIHTTLVNVDKPADEISSRKLRSNFGSMNPAYVPEKDKAAKNYGCIQGHSYAAKTHHPLGSYHISSMT